METFLDLGRSVLSYRSLTFAALDLYVTSSCNDIWNAIEYRHGLVGNYTGLVLGVNSFHY